MQPSAIFEAHVASKNVVHAPLWFLLKISCPWCLAGSPRMYLLASDIRFDFQGWFLTVPLVQFLPLVGKEALRTWRFFCKPPMLLYHVITPLIVN